MQGQSTMHDAMPDAMYVAVYNVELLHVLTRSSEPNKEESRFTRDCLREFNWANCNTGLAEQNIGQCVLQRII